MSDNSYYRVTRKFPQVPEDYHQYGYENRHPFVCTICSLHERWKGEVGLLLDKRPGRVHIRFRNKYNYTDDVWFFDFMVERAAPPPRRTEDYNSEQEKFLDEIYGFD